MKRQIVYSCRSLSWAFCISSLATGSLTAAQDASAPSIAPAAVDAEIPPEPIGDRASWITPDDYPPAAMRNDAEGRVGFSVLVEPDGKVSACEIFMSSGSSILDEATCVKITERARFSPARDAEGKARAGKYSSVVRWRIPDIQHPMPPASTLKYTFVVEKNGDVSDCRVLEEEGPGKYAFPCKGIGRIEPVVDEQGVVSRTKVTVGYVITHEKLPD